MTATIRVINPNASQIVTQGIDHALAPLRLTGGPEITCHTLHEGPPGIQSEADIMRVMPLLAEFIAAHRTDSAAFVIACFSDPGLAMAREATRLPVLGIGECAMLSALTRGHQIGVIAIQPTSIDRHRRNWGAMGITARLAGERALGLDVAALSDECQTWERLLDTGRRLRDEDQADVLILGCAGMPHYRHRLSEALEIPVIEPCLAATGMALAAACLEAGR